MIRNLCNIASYKLTPVTYLFSDIRFELYFRFLVPKYLLHKNIEEIIPSMKLKAILHDSFVEGFFSFVEICLMRTCLIHCAYHRCPFENGVSCFWHKP